VVAEHDEVIQLGGLYVLGTERHESRRIDNQLRGRSGRQGDPGESRFYLSLADDLMRMFNSGMVESFLTAAKVPDDVPIESRMVTRAIASAQSQVEGRNFEIRKNVLKYDDVLNRQREVIYGERRRVLEGADLHEQIRHFIDDVIRSYVLAATGEGFAEDWDLDQLWQAMKTLFPVTITLGEVVEEAGELSSVTQDMLLTELTADAQLAYDKREQQLGDTTMRELERRVVLSVLDRKWREHLYEMDYLQEGIGLRAMAQRDPLVEYQREGYLLFQAMTEAIKEESIGYLFHVEVEVAAEPELGDEAPVLVAKGLVTAQRPTQLQYSAPSVDGDGGVEVHAEDGAPVPEKDPSGETTNRAARRSSKKKRR
jgi:preprotein translocase subunit SecA